MTIGELKEKLFATKPPLVCLINQGNALKGLVASTDRQATEVLIGAVEAKHRLAGQISKALAESTDQGRVDCLWEHWHQERQSWLGTVLRSVNKPHAGSLALESQLKLGRPELAPQDRRTAIEVLGHLADKDADLRQASLTYIAALPNQAWANDEILDVWLRTQSADLERIIREQGRQPSSVPKEAVFWVAVGEVARYHAIQDETGQIFREGFAMAGDALRKRLSDVVVRSGDRRLIGAYSSAVGGEQQTDTVIEARKTAGDEDGLIEACRPLGVFDLLDVCERWAETGLRPTDPSRQKLVEAAVAGWRSVGKITFEAPTKLPSGMVDFFDWWEQQKTSDKDLAAGLTNPDPLVRAGSAWVSHRRGNLPPATVDKMAVSEDWPERLVARLVNPKYAAAPNEHVQWTSLAGGVIPGAILNTTAAGSPAELDAVRLILDASSGKSDSASLVNHGLAQILVAFQNYFQRGVIVASEDDSAPDRGAIAVQDGGEASREDLEF
jgi:hypothetical protein